MPLLLGLQDGGADVIELGVPFTDPMADGATIQRANEVALAHAPPVTLADCIGFVKKARAAGLTTPVVLMGYYNPLLAYGSAALMKDCADAGVDGFIVVDLPPEEGAPFVAECRKHKLCFVPLVTPASTDERIAQLATVADGFLYCVSLTGVTGARAELPKELPQFIKRVRANSNVPLAVGFGIATRAHVAEIATFADGVVVGSAVCKAVENVKDVADIRPTLAAFVQSLLPDSAQTATAKAARPGAENEEGALAQQNAKIDESVKAAAHFGEFGGRSARRRAARWLAPRCAMDSRARRAPRAFARPMHSGLRVPGAAPARRAAPPQRSRAAARRAPRGPQVHPRDAGRGAPRAGGGVRQGEEGPRLSRRGRGVPRAVHRRADAHVPREAPFCRNGRRADLAQARRARAHGRAQDQQRGRAGAARQAAGQEAHHCRDRRWPAWRRDCDRVRAARHRVRRLHGEARRRRSAPPARRKTGGSGAPSRLCALRRAARDRAPLLGASPLTRARAPARVARRRAPRMCAASRSTSSG